MRRFLSSCALLPFIAVRTGTRRPTNGLMPHRLRKRLLDLATSLTNGHVQTSALALVDQAVVSLGSFATHIVIIRACSPAAYGTFVLTWSVILFLNNIHAS